MTAARSRRYRQDGTVLTDGFTVRLPLGLDGEARRISRVLGVTLGDFASRALREAIERALDDPDVRSAVDAMRRLDARQSSDPQPSSETGVEEGEGGDGPRADRGGQEVVAGTSATSAPEASVVDTPSQAASAPPPEPRAPITDEERRRIGSIVRAARKSRQMAQDQVAKEIGYSEAYVCMIERANHTASPSACEKALAWAQAPHERDGQLGKSLPPKAAAAVAKKKNPMKRRAPAPATDWKPAVQTTPMVLPKGLELLPCPALRARITERACRANKARAKGDLVLGDHCPSCPGVVALSKRGRAA